jgi:hypothetical protein
MMMLIAEGLTLLLIAGTLLGPFAWIVLGAATYAANTRSGDLARTEAEGSTGAEPPVTRFARPAKLAAFTTAGLACLNAAVTTISALTRLGGSLGAALGYASLGLYVVQFGLLVALVGLLTAVLWDVRVGRRMAGHDAGVAYGVIAALHALQIGALVVLAMSGVQML